MPHDWPFRAALRGAGLVDLVLGVALAVLGTRVLTAVGIDEPSTPTFIRMLGVQVAAVGVVCILIGTAPDRSRSVLVACGITRLASGIVLLTGGPNVDGGEVLLAVLGIAELVLGIAHLLHARSLGPGSSTAAPAN